MQSRKLPSRAPVRPLQHRRGPLAHTDGAQRRSAWEALVVDLLAGVARALDQSHDAGTRSAWRAAAAGSIAALTARQRDVMADVMAMVLAGHPSKNIAADLSIASARSRTTAPPSCARPGRSRCPRWPGWRWPPHQAVGTGRPAWRSCRSRTRLPVGQVQRHNRIGQTNPRRRRIRRYMAQRPAGTVVSGRAWRCCAGWMQGTIPSASASPPRAGHRRHPCVAIALLPRVLCPACRGGAWRAGTAGWRRRAGT